MSRDGLEPAAPRLRETRIDLSPREVRINPGLVFAVTLFSLKVKAGLSEELESLRRAREQILEERSAIIHFFFLGARNRVIEGQSSVVFFKIVWNLLVLHMSIVYISWFKQEWWTYFCRFVFVCFTLI